MDAPAATQAPTRTPEPTSINELNSRFCEVFGLDANKVAGFRLTVLGGEFPALEVFVPPPVDEEGRFTDEQVAAMESEIDRFVVVPAGSQAALVAEQEGVVLGVAEPQPAG